MADREDGRRRSTESLSDPGFGERAAPQRLPLVLFKAATGSAESSARPACPLISTRHWGVLRLRWQEEGISGLACSRPHRTVMRRGAFGKPSARQTPCVVVEAERCIQDIDVLPGAIG